MTRGTFNRTSLGIAFLFAIVSSAVPRTGAAQGFSVDITPATVGHSEVDFFVKPSGSVSVASLANTSLVPSKRTEHGYVIQVDSSSYERDKNQRFTLSIYISQSGGSQEELYKYSVWENAGGSFTDEWANVTVNLKTRDFTDSAIVRLPTHSRDSNNLQLLSNKVLPLPMGSESTPTLAIKNALGDMHITFPAEKSVTVEDRNCPKCWSSLSGKVARSELSANGETTIDLDLHPDTVAILKQNLLPPPEDATPHQLSVTVVSTAENGGFPAPQEFSVSIAFTPAPPYLALSLAVGILLGLAMRGLIARKIDWLDFALQALLALVVWCFLLLAKTKASIFGFDFDPASLLPAGFLALSVAGGSSVGKRISEAIRKSRNP